MFISRVDFEKGFSQADMPSLRSRLHGFVMSMFPIIDGKDPREKFGVLWALEKNSFGRDYLLIQSNVPANPRPEAHIGRDFSVLQHVINYEKLLEDSPYISFRAHLNAVKVHDGARKPVKNPEDILRWWSEKADRAGLTVSDSAFIGRGVDSLQVRGGKFVISESIVTGVGEVKDKDLFLENVANGFGKSKSYGCGLVLLGKK